MEYKDLEKVISRKMGEAEAYISDVAEKAKKGFDEKVKPAAEEFYEDTQKACDLLVEDSERIYEENVKPAWTKVKTYAVGTQEELAGQEAFNSTALTGHAVKAGLLLGVGFAGHGLVLLGGVVVGADLGLRYFHSSQSKERGTDIPATKMPGIVGTYKLFKELED